MRKKGEKRFNEIFLDFSQSHLCLLPLMVLLLVMVRVHLLAKGRGKMVY